MADETKQKTLMADHGGRFIDPRNCGSTVEWVVDVRAREPDEKRKYEKRGWVNVCGHVRLADCNRSIRWEMDGKGAIEKIDAVINELQALRMALLKARTIKEDTKRRYKAMVKTEENDEEDDDDHED